MSLYYINPSDFNTEKVFYKEQNMSSGTCDVQLKDLYDKMQVNEYFISSSGGFPTPDSTYDFTVYRTENHVIVFNDSHILFYTPGIIKAHKSTLELRKQVFTMIGYERFNLNRHDYCHHMLDEFWKLVFGKTPNEMFCGGIVGAHSDKSSTAIELLKDYGCNANRATLLSLLLYTKMFDRTKHNRDQFVIDVYQKYLPQIEQAERLVFY